FFQAEDGIRDGHVTGVQTCALPISALPLGRRARAAARPPGRRNGRRARRRRALSPPGPDSPPPPPECLQGWRRAATARDGAPPRSEERRVGKEWRSGGWAKHE